MMKTMDRIKLAWAKLTRQVITFEAAVNTDPVLDRQSEDYVPEIEAYKGKA